MKRILILFCVAAVCGVAVSASNCGAGALRTANAVKIETNRVDVSFGKCQCDLQILEKRIGDIEDAQMMYAKRSEIIRRDASNYFAVVGAEAKTALDKEVKKLEILAKEKGVDEEFYKKRYEELSNGYERLITRIQIWLAIVALMVGVVGVALPLIAMHTQRKDFDKEIERIRFEVDDKVKDVSRRRHEINEEWHKIKKEFEEKIKEIVVGGMRSVAEMHKSKSELYFQLAKSVFEQYKILKSIDLLELVVKQLTHAIRHNIGAMDGKNLRTSIVVLNAALMKRVGEEDDDLPQEIVGHREQLKERLKIWVWEIDESLLPVILERSEVPDDKAKMSIANLKRIMDNYGERGDI